MKTYKLQAERHSDLKIEIYTDASFGSEHDMKSRTGIIIVINNCPIWWESKRNKVTSLSSVEAEYIALTASTRYFR
jgi:hypothetical protein